jgi:hypothetical protein
LLLSVGSTAQTNVRSDFSDKPKVLIPQSVATSLSTLPESDALIYISPQRITNDVVPKVLQESEVAKMRADFEDFKKNVGVDPSKLDYAVLAARFHKPNRDLNFVPPELLLVTSGDFSADSLLTMAHLFLQDNAQDEKYGSRTITLIKIDELRKAAETNPMLKSFADLGAVALNANTLAFGNIGYVKAAIDAADGNGRINPAVITSVLRDQNALLSVAGSPIAAFAKSFGMLGTDVAPREARCETKFGDFYGAVTMDADTFRLRAALNADNPDTAKIIINLLSGLWPAATGAMPDPSAQAALKMVKLLPQENEVIIQADIPGQTVASFIREQTKAKPPATPAPPEQPKKKPVRRRRHVKR